MNRATNPGGTQVLPLGHGGPTIAEPAVEHPQRRNEWRRAGSFVRALLHRALTHRVAMALKRPLKDGWWCVVGLALRNPAMPGRVESLLFVCKGNICRSPFAASRAARLLQALGRGDIRCASAGITATQAARPPAEASEVASEFGCGISGHEPLRLTREMVGEFDLLVVMEAEQLVQLRQQYPEAFDRLVLLPLVNEWAAGYARYNIADPFGQDVATFRSCYARIDAALRLLLSRLPAPSGQAAIRV
jgi:protein-tyrosine phosphatase